MSILIKSMDERIDNIIRKADLEQPINTLGRSIINNVEVKNSKMKLMIGGYYNTNDNEIFLGKRNYTSTVNKKEKRIFRHELAHHLHKNIHRLYLLNEDEDLVKNTINYLHEAYHDKNLKKIPKDMVYGSMKETIANYLHKYSDSKITEGFATYIEDHKIYNLMKLAQTGCTLAYIKRITKPAALNLIRDYILFTTIASITIYVYHFTRKEKNNFYKKWLKKYNSGERLALLAFPPNKLKNTDKTLKQLEDYSLVI